MITVGISSAIAHESFKVRIDSSPVLGWIVRLLLSIIKAYISRLNKIYTNLSTAADESLRSLGSYSIDDAELELKALRKFLPRINKLTAKLDSIDFFEHPELKEKVGLTLDKLYELEAELKIKAAPKINNKRTPVELSDELSKKSIEAISLGLDKK